MKSLEIEKTYLAKYIPEDLVKSKSEEVFDIYIPKNSRHPVLRLRKKGKKYEMTKKEPVKETDASEQHEHTIHLTKEEFDTLGVISGKKLRKVRYYYDYKGTEVEVGVFKDDLEGLVLVDVEFKTSNNKKDFEMPDFCLADVTDEEFVAGGMLCGKKYLDLELLLDKYNYKKLF